MTRKTSRTALAALAAGAAVLMVIWPVAAALVAVLFGASAAAAANPCYTTVAPVLDSGGPVRLPVVGQYRVSSEYGMRVHPITKVYKLHDGIDLAEMPTPTQVVAAKDGVVTDTPTGGGGGNQVVISHGSNLETVYMHLQSRIVHTGDQVHAGQPVGIEGSTGYSTGEHVHFTVRVNGAPTDPRAWLAQQGITLPATGGTGTAPPAVSATSTAGEPPGTQQVRPILLPLAPTSTLGAAKPVATQLPAQVGAYHGEQVTNAALIIKAGQAQGLDVKAITIAVMTAIAESGLVNVPHGDNVRSDTIGLFQEGPERGPAEQRMDPTGAASIFYRYLLAVPGYLTLEPTIAAHKAQANADPYHYTQFWAAAVQIVSTLTADPDLLAQLPATGPITGCQNPTGPAPAVAGGGGAGIVEAAQHYLGTPYSWGGGTTTGPSLGIRTSGSLDGTRTVGFDCSGLVLYAVYQATGIRLPHDAEAQGKDSQGQPVPRDWAAMQPGDIIAFSENGSGAPGSYGHVGIYIGNGQMIHAPRPGKNVETTQLQGSTYYAPMAWSIRRFAAAAALG